MAEFDVEKESLKDEMKNVVDEARMVLPDIQAVFGFQTVSVFTERYSRLPDSGIVAHLVALVLLALAIALVMTPAAYHRLAERGQVSRKLIDRSSRLITMGMVPLMTAFALDVYVILLATLGSPLPALAAAIATACVFLLLWFVYPVRSRTR